MVSDPWVQRSHPEEACRFRWQTAWVAVVLHCPLLSPAGGEYVTTRIIYTHCWLHIKWYDMPVTWNTLWYVWNPPFPSIIIRVQRIQEHGVCVCVFACLYLPEPNYLFAVPCVVSIHRVPLPVLQIYLLHATQHHLVQTHTRRHIKDAQRK